MAEVQGQSMYCYACKKSFANWDAFFVHKLQTRDHICCIFCGQDYKTVDGCQRHLHQSHSAEQDLTCVGCGSTFVRIGSYISHIELKQCKVIHKSEFEARRVRKLEVYGKESLIEVPGEAGVPQNSSNTVKDKANSEIPSETANANVNENGNPIKYDYLREISWEDWGDNDPAMAAELFPALMRDTDFPALPSQEYREGGSKVADLLSGLQDDIDEKKLAWFAQGRLFPTSSRASEQATATQDHTKPGPNDGERHQFDPDNPDFKCQDYYNHFTEKYWCPWPGCTKLSKAQVGFIHHLKSSAHMDLKLRCPQCLRQFQSATALVQHAEAQTVNCKIRDTSEYSQAIDLLTAGFIDTAGRHRDETIRYIATPTGLDPMSMLSTETLNKGTAAFIANQGHAVLDRLKRMNDKNQDW